jgi:cation:H+ antiporter
MIYSVVAFFLALALLTWSADRLIDGSVAAATHSGMSPRLAGLLVGGFGAAAPELAVGVVAALAESPSLAVGTAWGANMVLLSLIVGSAALAGPLVLRSGLVTRELMVLLAAIGLTALLSLDRELSRWDGLVLLAAFALLLGWTVRQIRRRPDDPLPKEAAQGAQALAIPAWRAWVWIALGAIVLAASARLLVWAAADMAHWLGAGEWLVGLSAVAAGTALPELVACVALSRRGMSDLVLGHVVGASLFNLLAVVGLAVLLTPVGIEYAALHRDLPAMAGLTLALIVLAWRPGRKASRIQPWAGALLLAAYVAYLGWVLGGYGFSAGG